MTAQQLKNSILQMAVQGKLVPQDPNDEPASVLLERICAEKERLIGEKKIKREKNPSVIFRGPDNTPYEKVGDTITPLEVPFEIPESWEWVRLGDVCEYIQRGKSPKYSPIKKFPVVAQKCNQWSGFSIEKAQFIEPDSLASYGFERILQDNDLMWNSTGLGTLGRMAIYKVEVNPYGLAVADSHVTVIRPFKQLVLPEYLYFYFANPTVQKVIHNQADGTTKQKELATATIKAYLTPIPPLKEQRRILAKLSEVLSIVQNYGEIYGESVAMQDAFAARLKKSILQQAVQGKLVPQDPADEPAEVLLKRIRAEKQRLVKEGKIKKDKHESVIFRRDNSHYELVDGVERCIDEELPFEIPESWMWDRLGNVFSLQAGKNIQASEIEEAIFDGAFLCYGGNGIRGYVGRFNREGDYPIIGRQGALCGNINRATGKFYATEHAVCVETFCNIDVDWTCLFLNALNLNQYATATAQPGLAVAKINQVLIPVPPLSEQHRIAAKIEELLPLIQSI